MKKVRFLLLVLPVIVSFQYLYAAETEPLRLFTSTGKPVTYKHLLDAARTSDVVFVGEFHNNPASHWLQIKLLKSLIPLRSVQLGAEMFETNQQDFLDKRISGAWTDSQLDSATKLWPNYATDYAAVVELASRNKLPFTATNIPRKIAGKVAYYSLSCLDTMPPDIRKMLPPLPIPFEANLECYKNMEAMGGHGAHAMPFITQAQAVKDATMAHFICTTLKPGNLMLHLNGAYHSDLHQGIVWYVKKYRPELKILTITTVTQNSLNTLEDANKGLADFVLCVDSDLTTSY
jgi:uncharacterized iron-regulated protein